MGMSQLWQKSMATLAGSTSNASAILPETQTTDHLKPKELALDLKPGALTYFKTAYLLDDQTRAMEMAVEAAVEASMQRETRFKEKIQRELSTLPNFWAIKTQERARKGVPDLLCCVQGSFVALELKVEDGDVKAIQSYTLEQINKAGGVAIVVTPNTWDEVFRLLQKLAGVGD